MSEVDAARRVLTPAQLETWLLNRRGMSTRSLALHYGVSREAIRDRLRRAQQKIDVEVAGEQDAGEAPATGDARGTGASGGEGTAGIGG